jgi:hypothetical protein
LLASLPQACCEHILLTSCEIFMCVLYDYRTTHWLSTSPPLAQIGFIDIQTPVCFKKWNWPHDNRLDREGDMGCLPFTWKFRWFHTESKWNKHISTAQPELFRNERFVWKGCPLLPIGTFQLVNVVPFTSFLFFHQFQALLDLTIGIIKWKAHNPNGIFYPKFCLPLAQFQTGWVFHVNGKQPMVVYHLHGVKK